MLHGSLTVQGDFIIVVFLISNEKKQPFFKKSNPKMYSLLDHAPRIYGYNVKKTLISSLNGIPSSSFFPFVHVIIIFWVFCS